MNFCTCGCCVSKADVLVMAIQCGDLWLTVAKLGLILQHIN